MAKITEVKEINLPELELYASRSEVKLYRHDEPEPGLFAAESLKVIDRALAAGYRPVSFLFEKNVFREKAAYLAERFPDTDIYLADEETMTGITGYRLTGGALSLMRRKSLPSFTDICTGKKRLAVLEDVENPANVGAIIRSAAALGIGGVLLTTDCTDPLYRRAVRVSMGTVFQVPWTITGSGPALAEQLKAEGWTCLALALTEDALPLDSVRFASEEKAALFLGAEGEGLKAETIKACDASVIIPMAGGVDSLNVAAASAVAFWAVSHQIKDTYEK